MAAATHAKSAAGWCRPQLQGHQLEIALICASGLRLCLAAAAAGCSWLACCLALVHLLPLLLEFGSTQKLVSPYSLRRSDSHGLAQGVLAVPSVLAALAAAAPQQGSWNVWALASCVAAAAIILTVYVQSKAAATAAAATITATNKSQKAGKPVRAQQHNDSHQLYASEQQLDQHRQQQHQWQQFIKWLPAAFCGVVAAAAAWLAAAQHYSLNIFLQQQLNFSLGRPASAASPALMLAAASTAVLAPAMYCLLMRLLPSCFSIGEGALMAQGAASLAAAAALVVPEAPVFVPDCVCQLLPPAVRVPLSRMGGCSSTARSRALSLEALPAAILLVAASTLVLCLLLRTLLAVLGGSSSGGPGESTIAQKRNTAATSSSVLLGRVLLAVPLAASMVALLLWLVCAAAWTLLEFMPARQGRVLVLLYWVGLMGLTLPALGLWVGHSKVPQIIVRKVYHLLAGGLFVPVFFWDLPMLCWSLAIAFAALQLLEVVRHLQLPRLGAAVEQFMQDFVDERDSGVIYVTHFTLLLGLAVPMWLCLGLPGVEGFAGSHSSSLMGTMQCSGSSNSSGSEGGCLAAATSSDALVGSIGSGFSIGDGSRGNASALLLVTAGLSGMVIIGVGDTAASMVGKLLGRVPIHAGSRKTVEGTVAGIASSLGAWCLLLWAGGMGVPGGMSWCWWLQLLLATAGAGLMEAVTSQLDNVLLPLWYLPHLLLVQQ